MNIRNDDEEFAYESCDDAKCDCRQFFDVREAEEDYEPDDR